MVKVTKHGEQTSPILLPHKKRESKPRRTKEEKKLIIKKFDKLINTHERVLNHIWSFGIENFNREELEKIAKEGDLTISELRYCLRLLLKNKQKHKKDYFDYIDGMRR